MSLAGNEKNELDIPDAMLENEVIGQAIAEDPVARFIIKWRKVIVAIAIVGLVGFYWNRSIRDNRILRGKEAADQFFAVRAGWKELLDKKSELLSIEKELKTLEGEKKDTQEKRMTALKEELDGSASRLDAKLTALSDTQEPYKKIAQIFRNKASRMFSQIKPGSDSSTAIVLEGAMDGPVDPGKFLDELSLFEAANSLVDQDGRGSEAKNLLTELAKEGKFLAPVAAISLATLSSTPDEKTNVGAIISDLISKYPEQRAALEEESKKLGIDLK